MNGKCFQKLKKWERAPDPAAGKGRFFALIQMSARVASSAAGSAAPRHLIGIKFNVVPLRPPWDMYPHLFVLAQRDGGTRQRKALHPYRLLPQTLPLAVPKNFGGMRLERGKAPLACGGVRGPLPLF